MFQVEALKKSWRKGVYPGDRILFESRPSLLTFVLSNKDCQSFSKGSYPSSLISSHSFTINTMLSTAAKTLLALAATTSAFPTFDSLSARAATAPGTYCGKPNADQVISGTPWIVFSMNYNYQKIDGSCCTSFTGLVTGANGEQQCGWSSDWKIAKDANAGLVKGYSFVGLTQGLENKISDIASIPATYEWVRSNTTAYEGIVP